MYQLRIVYVITYLLWRDSQLLRELLLLLPIGVRIVLVPLEPGVQAVVDEAREAGVLHAQLLLHLDGAGVLLAQLVPHAAGQVGRGAEGGRVLDAVVLPAPLGHGEVAVEALLPETGQGHAGLARLAEAVIGL